MQINSETWKQVVNIRKRIREVADKWSEEYDPDIGDTLHSIADDLTLVLARTTEE